MGVSTTTSGSRSLSLPRTWRPSSQRCRGSSTRTSPSSDGGSRGEEAAELFADDPLKLERLQEFGSEEVITVYRGRALPRPLSGAARAEHGTTQALQAPLDGGCLLGGRRDPADAAANLRDRLLRRRELDEHIERLEEARKRDHRILGRQLDLFTVDSRVGSGLILWRPLGAIVRDEIEAFERELILRHGYEIVYTPHVMSERLFEISGHLENFAESMFGAVQLEGGRYRPKPMNCPGHICLYQAAQRSYRELPIRYAEFGTVYRYERSGVLHGMLRVRGFTQDDAHVFCTKEQVPGEIEALLTLVDEMLTVFGYPYTVVLATRPEKALGTDEEWNDAISVLREVLDRRHVEYRVEEGGGAFYGPKLDFELIDAIGRPWQGPTVQLDFNLPERFNIEYISDHNERPAARDAAPCPRGVDGALRRGPDRALRRRFPLWLAPEQVRVLPVSEAWSESAEEFLSALTDHGIRATLARRESLSYRIREGEIRKVPYMCVIGEREASEGTVAVRNRGLGKKQEIMGRDAFLERIRSDVRRRAPGP